MWTKACSNWRSRAGQSANILQASPDRGARWAPPWRGYPGAMDIVGSMFSIQWPARWPRTPYRDGWRGLVRSHDSKLRGLGVQFPRRHGRNCPITRSPPDRAAGSRTLRRRNRDKCAAIWVRFRSPPLAWGLAPMRRPPSGASCCSSGRRRPASSNSVSIATAHPLFEHARWVDFPGQRSGSVTRQNPWPEAIDFFRPVRDCAARSSARSAAVEPRLSRAAVWMARTWLERFKRTGHQPDASAADRRLTNSGW